MRRGGHVVGEPGQLGAGHRPDLSVFARQLDDQPPPAFRGPPAELGVAVPDRQDGIEDALHGVGGNHERQRDAVPSLVQRDGRQCERGPYAVPGACVRRDAARLQVGDRAPGDPGEPGQVGL